MENKASISSTSCLTCVRSVVRYLHVQLESLPENLNLDTQLNSSSGTPRKSPRLTSRPSIVLVSERLAKSPTGVSPASKATKIAQRKSESHLKPGLHTVVTVAEQALGDASKRILKPSIYPLQLFLVKHQ